MNRFNVFGVLVLVGLHQSYANGHCEEGWEYFDQSCYFISGMTANSNDAHDLCKATGGYLVRINSRHENEYLKMRARAFNSSFWIDGTDAAEEGRWVYSSGYTQIGFTDWNPGQPDNKGGQQNCLWLYKKYNFRWDDCACNTEPHFICEKNPETRRC